MLAAIAAKEAKVDPSQEQPLGQLRKAQPSKTGKARSPDSKLSSNPKATIRLDLRGEISGEDGKNPTFFCLAIKNWHAKIGSLTLRLAAIVMHIIRRTTLRMLMRYKLRTMPRKDHFLRKNGTKENLAKKPG